MTEFDTYTRHALSTLAGQGKTVFPRHFRSNYTSDVRDNIKQARIDLRKALLGRDSTLTEQESETLRNAINEMYRSTTDVLLAEIERYFGDEIVITYKNNNDTDKDTTE